MRIFMVEYVSADEPASNEVNAFTDAEGEKQLQVYWPVIRDFENGDTLTLLVGLSRVTIRAEVLD